MLTIGLNAVLVLVDLQDLFAEMVGVGHPAIERNRRLATVWRDKRGSKRMVFPFVGWKDDGEVPGNIRQFASGIVPLLTGGCAEATFIPGVITPEEQKSRTERKTSFDATRQTGLPWRLRAEGVSEVFVCGLTTPVCVAETVNGLVQEGFKVTLIADACASQAFPPYSAEEAHEQAVARLRALWCNITTTEEVIVAL